LGDVASGIPRAARPDALGIDVTGELPRVGSGRLAGDVAAAELPRRAQRARKLSAAGQALRTQALRGAQASDAQASDAGRASDAGLAIAGARQSQPWG